MFGTNYIDLYNRLKLDLYADHEVQATVLSKLSSARDLCNAELTCRSWFALAVSDGLWCISFFLFCDTACSRRPLSGLCAWHMLVSSIEKHAY